jgi:hypothetical protein
MTSKRTSNALAVTRSLASRRDFVWYGAGFLGTCLLSPFASRSASAQTSSTTFDYYISPTGSDANPGTVTQPWAITALNSHRSLYAGKRVGLMDGTYDLLTAVGGLYANDWATPAFNIAGGSAGSPTVVQSVNARGAILDGRANGTNNPGGQPLIGTLQPVAGTGYIIIDGLEVKNGFNRLVSVGAVTGAATPSSRLVGVIVRNCYIHSVTNTLANTNPTGLTIYSCDGALIQNNFITDIQDVQNRTTGIEVWTSVNCVVELNSVVSAGNLCNGCYFKNTAQYNNTFRFNFIDVSAAGTNGSSTGIAFDLSGTASNALTVNNNIVVGDDPVSSGIMAISGFPNWPEKQNWFNNTFVGTPANSVNCWSRFSSAAAISFYNNVISRTTTGGRGDVNANASSFGLIDYNCYPAAPRLGLTADGQSGYPTTLYSTLSAWATALPAAAVGKDAHSKAGSPMFVGGVGPAAYRLQSGSPCAGTGSSTGTVTGAATDMGAWGNGASRIGADFGPAPPPAKMPIAVT